MNRQNILVVAALVLVAFLIGFGWQFTRARALGTELEQTTEQLTWKELEVKLAAATIEAQRGNFEISRQLSSEFFTRLQNEIGRAPDDKRLELQAISNQRDAIITAASRSDPQTASLLGQLYSTYRVAFGEAPVTPLPAPEMPPPPSTTSP